MRGYRVPGKIMGPLSPSVRTSVLDKCPSRSTGASAARSGPSGTSSVRGVLGLEAQQVARLAFEYLAERGERREAHRLGAAVLEHRQVGGRDPYAVRELAHG